MSSGPNIHHSLEALWRDTLQRLTAVERRLVPTYVPPVIPSGSTLTGTLDPLYRGWGPAKVKIDGVLTSVELNWSVPYQPNASRLVRLMWNGTEYLIMGQATDETVYLNYDDTKLAIYGEIAGDAAWNLRPRATKLALSGLVVLSGMTVTKGTPALSPLIGNLPVGMRPPIRLIFPIEWGDQARSLTIEPSGDLVLTGPVVGPNSYVSLDGIAFYPDGVGTWTTVGDGGSSWGANFGPWTDANYVPCQFYKDPWGFVWWRGLARVNVTTTVNSTPIVNVLAAYRSQLSQHIRTSGNDIHAAIYGESSYGLGWMAGSPGSVGAWISLSAAVFVTADALALNPWKDISAFSNGWGNYSVATFPSAGYVRREDGLCLSKGLLNAGTINTRAAVMTEEEMWPAGGAIILATVSNQARARLDVRAARDTGSNTVEGPGAMVHRTASNAWFSWDGLKWVP